jgi:hypothetical protein
MAAIAGLARSAAGRRLESRLRRTDGRPARGAPVAALIGRALAALPENVTYPNA